MSEKPPGPVSAAEMANIRREAIAFAGIGLYRYKLDGSLVFIDGGALKILDLDQQYPDPSVLTGRNIGSLLEYKQPKGSLRREILEKKHVVDFQYPFRTLSGKDRWALHDSYLTRDRQTGEPLIQVIIRDITARKQAERALAAEHERLAVTLRSIGDAVIATDAGGVVALMNRMAEILTGWNHREAVGRPLPEVFRIINEITRKTVENPADKVLRQGRVVGLANHTVLISRDGTERNIADSGAPIFDPESRVVGVVLVFRDVTEELRLRKEREKTQRLGSLGVLAGGIAHDFNNYLTGVLGNVSLARTYARASRITELLDCLDEAEKATLRARNLTRQLLTFSKGGEPRRQPVAVMELCRDSVEFALHGSGVKAEYSAVPDLWHVRADHGQLGQVFQNVTLNAKQAMPDGGRLEVSAANVDGRQCAEGSGPGGRFVLIQFRDHGCGISADNLPRVFDPYFTTKPAGTGLGLATAYSIVTRHGGRIVVDSRVGDGTCVSVYVPACDPPAAPAPESRTAPGSGRVLVMDDEDFVRKISGSMLRALGYEPVCVSDGAAAVRACAEARAAGRPFDAVVLDLTVRGGMGGVRALAEIAAAHPGVTAIVASGYSTDPVLANPAAYGFKAVVTKPYNLEELARVLSHTLCRRAPDGQTP